VANTYRLLTTAGLTYFSEAHKAFNITSLITQGIGLWGTLSLPWLRLEQSLVAPYKDLSNATINTYALLSSNVAKNAGCLRTVISNIADLQRRIISQGTVMMETTYNDIGVPRRVVEFTYKLPKITDLREFITKPCLWSFGGSVIERSYGDLPLRVLNKV